MKEDDGDKFYQWYLEQAYGGYEGGTDGGRSMSSYLKEWETKHGIQLGKDHKQTYIRKATQKQAEKRTERSLKELQATIRAEIKTQIAAKAGGLIAYVTELSDTDEGKRMAINEHDMVLAVCLDIIQESGLDRIAKGALETHAQVLCDAVVSATGRCADPGLDNVAANIKEIQEIAHETWEDWCDQVETGPPTIALEGDPKDHLVSGIKFIDTGDAVELASPHGHQVLAASRRAVDAQLRVNAAAMASRAAKANPNQTVCVYDVGAGASGLERAATTRRYQAYKGVYFHCSVPIADDADTHRAESMRETIKGYAHINWVDRTKTICKDRLNACTHRARDCDCLKLYDVVFGFSVHSAYYFEYDDWENLMTTTDMRRLDIAIHVPVEGRSVPAHGAGEFSWLSVEDSQLPLATKAKLACKRLVTGNRHMVFEPERTMGTRYHHPDIRQLLDTGGVHLHPMAKAANRPWGETVANAAAAAGAYVLTCALPWRACGLLPSLPIPYGTAVTVGLEAAAVFAGSIATTRAIATGFRQPALPGLLQSAETLSLSPGKTWTYFGEEIVSTYTLRRVPKTVLPSGKCTRYQDLEPALHRSPNIFIERADDVTAGLVLSANDEAIEAAVSSGQVTGSKPMNAACALLLRAGAGIDSVKDTVMHSAGRVRFLGRRWDSSSPGPSLPSPVKPRGSASAWAAAGLEFSASAALLTPPGQTLVASALGPYTPIALPLTLVIMGASFVQLARLHNRRNGPPAGRIPSGSRCPSQ